LSWVGRWRGGAALFQVVNRRSPSARASRSRPTAASANGGEIFDDPAVAAAMLDRLMRRSIIGTIDSELPDADPPPPHHTNNRRKAITVSD
jgi:hypothetical protein